MSLHIQGVNYDDLSNDDLKLLIGIIDTALQDLKANDWYFIFTINYPFTCTHSFCFLFSLFSVLLLTPFTFIFVFPYRSIDYSFVLVILNNIRCLKFYFSFNSQYIILLSLVPLDSTLFLFFHSIYIILLSLVPFKFFNVKLLHHVPLKLIKEHYEYEFKYLQHEKKRYQRKIYHHELKYWKFIFVFSFDSQYIILLSLVLELKEHHISPWT